MYLLVSTCVVSATEREREREGGGGESRGVHGRANVQSSNNYDGHNSS